MSNILATLRKLRPMAEQTVAGPRCHDALASGATWRITLSAHVMLKLLGSARA